MTLLNHFYIIWAPFLKTKKKKKKKKNELKFEGAARAGVVLKVRAGVMKTQKH